MKKWLLVWFFVLSLSMTAKAEGNIFSAKLNIEKSENAVLNQDNLFYLPASHVQKDDGILFEAEQMGRLLHNSKARLQMENGCISILNVRAMEFHFDVVKSGNYRAWYRAAYPTTLPYNHSERMDDGKSTFVMDSNDQQPNVFRWHKGPVYFLEKGKHVWDFPTPTAWCGGTKLDKLLLLPENISVLTDKIAAQKTEVNIPDSGEIVIRRIQTRHLRKWRINADAILNGGKFLAEYHYNGQEFQSVKAGDWQMVPDGVRYLYLRFRLEKGKDAKLSPFVYDLELQVEEK